MNDLLERYGPWALITGASSGIGKEFSHQLAKAGFHIALLARRESRLNELAAELSSRYGVKTKTLTIDLAEHDFLTRVTDATADVQIGLLVNCAGFAVTGALIETALKDNLVLIQVNCVATVAMSHHFGGLMAAQGRGGIINVSSAASFLPVPNWSTYASSKAFVRFFSEAIWFEFKKKGVDVLAFCPGSTDTEFNKKAGITMTGMGVTPVVDCALKNIGKRPSVVVGIGNWLATTLTRFVSRKGNIWLGSLMIPTPRKTSSG